MAPQDEERGRRPELTDEDELAVRLERGRSLLAEGQAAAACEALEEALDLARQLDDTAAEASVGGLLAQGCLRLGRPDEAERHARAALQIARVRRDAEAAEQLERLVATTRSSPEAIEMSGKFGDGRAALGRGEADRALELLGRARELAAGLGHEVAEAASLHFMARAHCELGDREAAEPLARRALEMARAAGDDQAAELCEELVERIEAGAACGVPGLEAPDEIVSELHAGQSALAAGEIDKGVEHLERARAGAVEAGQLVPEAAACGLLAQAYLELERNDEAAGRARRAAELAEQLGQPEAAAELRMLVDMAGASRETHELAREVHAGAAALEAGRPAEAVEPLERALAAAAGQRNEVAEAMVAGLLARALSVLDRREEAARHARRGREIALGRGEADSVAYFEALVAELERETKPS